MSREEPLFEIDEQKLRQRTRRDFLFFGACAIAGATGLRWLMHETPSPSRQRFLDGALAFDDYVAEALYSKDRSVRAYRRSDATALRNNYGGKTPTPEYLADWKLTLSGLAAEHDVVVTLDELLQRFTHHDQVTRLCCVEGWSAIAWWGGLSFHDVLRAWPPRADAKWASLESAVNLDPAGRPDPYYVSIDLPTAEHPQTLLATHQGGAPLVVAHGAPLRLVAPMKLGLKNIKAITKITYTVERPRDYWGARGYSQYDGL